jgi:hypothetical protein
MNKNEIQAGTTADKCTAADNSTSASLVQNGLLGDVLSFVEFERTCKKEIRGGVMMYDVKGHYKWLTANELSNWYFRRLNIP